MRGGALAGVKGGVRNGMLEGLRRGARACERRGVVGVREDRKEGP